MKLVESKYKIEFEKTEVEVMVDYLHKAYMALREDDANKETAIAMRELRNNFASLVGRRFMGIDA